MNKFGKRLRRLMFLTHRWTGVFACLLMTLWFVSGIVMLFVGYPRLLTPERVARLPELPVQACCAPLDQALFDAQTDATEIRLTSIAGKPAYRFRDGKSRFTVLDAVTGMPMPAVDEQHAVASASVFGGGHETSYEGTVMDDRWTRSTVLNPHRPLHKVRVHDAQDTLLYVSSRTGEVMLDAPRWQRAWNYVGAWLHWLYMLRSESVDPTWRWLVIALSSLGVVSATTGIVVGIWRWRWPGRYKTGAHTPYRERYMRWHHLLGLTFALVVWTWIFSGLMSMNPARVFDAGGSRPDIAAYRGADLSDNRLPATPAQVVQRLRDDGFRAVELEWRVLAAEPYVLARDAENATRLVLRGDEGLVVMREWPQQALLHAAAALMPQGIADHAWLQGYDAFYYARTPESMYGASERGLPALRVDFLDAGATRAYIDAATGSVVLSLDRSQRWGRWLFQLLHSWDLPVMLDSSARVVVLVILGIGGGLLCATACVIAWRRVRLQWPARRATPAKDSAR